MKRQELVDKFESIIEEVRSSPMISGSRIAEWLHGTSDRLDVEGLEGRFNDHMEALGRRIIAEATQ